MEEEREKGILPIYISEVRREDRGKEEEEEELPTEREMEEKGKQKMKEIIYVT